MQIDVRLPADPALHAWTEQVRASALPLRKLVVDSRGNGQLAARFFLWQNFAFELQSHGQEGAQEARLMEICPSCAYFSPTARRHCSMCGEQPARLIGGGSVSYLGQQSGLYPVELIERHCESLQRRMEECGVDPLTSIVAGHELVELFQTAILTVFKFRSTPPKSSHPPLP